MTATVSTTAAITATTDVSASAGTVATTSGQLAVFQIDPNQSKVLFSLGEDLMGKPNIVTGTATKVSGAISVTLDNPANSTVGPIQVDATSFATDSGMRDRMIQRFILQAQDAKFQYITFEPTAIEGLPATVSVGTEIPLTITGNLKILNASQPVTFNGTAMLKSDTELQGSAKTTVNFADYGISIPQVPSVANVTPQVSLEIQLVATKQ
jgi:polyisoprenoid-binding protein YceI